MDDLASIATALVAPGKGILASDESFPTIEKRFASIGITSTEETRRAYREMLFTTPGIENFISGVILFDETIKDKTLNGVSFPDLLNQKGIFPGIKVDQGLKDMTGFAGDKLTDGLQGLSDRLTEYKNLGAKFTKWRAAFTVTTVNPSIQCVEENAIRLAEFAFISQQNGLVPIVEPEILMDGNHSLDKCYETTRSVLRIVFMKLKDKKIDFKGMLLKPNMILPGSDSPKVSPSEVAHKTIEVLKEIVPVEVPGIVFLSGGQSEEEATANLKEMNREDTTNWQLSFSFGRALQESAMKTWAGNESNIKLAQDKFLERAKANSEARYGR